MVVVAIGVLAVLGSSWFAVDQVTVTGNVYTEQQALDAVIDDLTGTPVLLVDIDAVEAQIEAIPWVEDARVRTSFPDAATIEIRERTPVAAMMGADGQARVIDVDGRVLGLVDGQPVALVWISGPGTLDVAPGQFVVDRVLVGGLGGHQAHTGHPQPCRVDVGHSRRRRSRDGAHQ